jgi:hypothetical protein
MIGSNFFVQRLKFEGSSGRISDGGQGCAENLQQKVVKTAFFFD